MKQYELSHLDIPCLVKRFVHIYFIIICVELKSINAIVFVRINQDASKKTRDLDSVTESLLECAAYY